jgi:hypothetical protein
MISAIPPVHARGRLWTPAFAGVTKRSTSRAFRVAGPKAFAKAPESTGSQPRTPTDSS